MFNLLKYIIIYNNQIKYSSFEKFYVDINKIVYKDEYNIQEYMKEIKINLEIFYKL